MKTPKVQIEAVNRTFQLFQRYGRGNYYVCFTPDAEVSEKTGQKRKFLSTKCKQPGPARLAAIEILKKYFRAKDEHGEVKIAALEEAAEKQRGNFATLGEICRVYRTNARTVRNKENIKPATIQANVNALAFIAAGHFVNGGTKRVGDEWENLRSDRVLTAKTLNAFIDGSLKAVTQREVPMDKARRSTNSYLNFARSIFGKEYLPLYADAGLRLPDLTGFLGVSKHRISKVKTKFVALVPALLQKIETDLRAIRDEHPDWWLAFLLMRYLGLRRSEVREARKLWIRESAQGPELAIIKYDYASWGEEAEYTPKQSEGALLIPENILADLKQFSPARRPLDHLVGISEKSMKKFSKWFGAHLVGRRSNKTLHVLRGQAISEIVAKYGVTKALKFSRHADVQTLIDSYLDDVTDERPILQPGLHVLPDPKTVAA